MKEILLIIIVGIYVSANEPMGLPPQITNNSLGISFKVDTSYIKIPTSTDINYLEFSPILQAKAKKEAEEAKAKKEAEEAKAQKEAEEAKAQKEADEVKVQKEADEAKAQKEADEVETNEIPLAETFPLEEGEVLEPAILNNL